MATETKTEEVLESEGIQPTKHYALRADHLADGSYRYALENPETGAVFAEGVDRDDRRAMERLTEALARAGLSPAEVRRLTEVTEEYEEDL